MFKFLKFFQSTVTFVIYSKCSKLSLNNLKINKIISNFLKIFGFFLNFTKTIFKLLKKILKFNVNFPKQF